MTTIAEQIQSVRQTLGREYIRPPQEKANAFQEVLWSADGEVGLEYWRTGRALNDDTIKHFGLGFDKDKQAVTIPVYKKGVLVNIKYRYLNPEKGKYSGETGAETWIFNDDGIQEGRTKGGVLVVEGEIDLMSCWQAGIKNVVSPASGKDSYGVWLELLDTVPKVYIAYDNDEAGKTTAMKMAQRTGIEKTFEVKYPDGVKDANEFFKVHTKEDFLALIKKSAPYYSYQFKNVGDIISGLMNDDASVIEVELMPKVKIEDDWLIVVSGKTNIGKTGYALNIVKELSERGIPTLTMPFERGVASVGRRFLQILFGKTLDDLAFTSKEEWGALIDRAVETPAYFAVPKRDEILDTIRKAKRLFNTRVVVIDHLDYLVRQSNENQNVSISNSLQELKALAMECKVIMIVITHIRKIEQAGAVSSRKPNIEDLKGSSSLYQDPEAVILLSSDEVGTILVDVAKNKGEMRATKFNMNVGTGVISQYVDDF